MLTSVCMLIIYVQVTCCWQPLMIVNLVGVLIRDIASYNSYCLPIGTRDMKHVLNAVEKLSAKWIFLSVELGIEESTLELIEHYHPGDAKMCLYKVLREWLKLNHDITMHGKPSWSRLAEAVKSLKLYTF